MSSNKIQLVIDASRSIDSLQKTGVEKVSDELLKEIHHQNEDVIYYTPKKINWLPENQQKILNWPIKYLWTQIRLCWELWWHAPNKFFVPVHKIPLWFLVFNKKTEKYLLIHDIAFKKNPELYSNFKKWYLNFDLQLSLKKCKKIFVPTQAVKNDILKYFPKFENKIIPIHHGHSRTQNSVNRTQEKKKQILYIGRVEKKKNIRNLIKAFKLFLEKNSDYELILAGKVSTALSTQLTELRKGPEDKIKILGYISEEKKKELLRESEALVLVSKEEGFGFPILEAWDYELPILVSNIPVLKEIGGDACLYCNPNFVEDIAEKIEKVISDKNLQQDLIQKGKQRIKKFSWQNAAQKYLANLG